MPGDRRWNPGQTQGHCCPEPHPPGGPTQNQAAGLSWVQPPSHKAIMKKNDRHTIIYSSLHIFKIVIKNFKLWEKYNVNFTICGIVENIQIGLCLWFLAQRPSYPCVFCDKSTRSTLCSNEVTLVGSWMAAVTRKTKS